MYSVNAILILLSLVFVAAVTSSKVNCNMELEDIHDKVNCLLEEQTKHAQKIHDLEKQNNDLHSQARALTGSTERITSFTYIRWGRTTCPDNYYTELLYPGSAAGSHFTEQGGGSNYLCLPMHPEWNRYSSTLIDWKAYVWGAEYQVEGASGFPFNNRIRNHDVPCALCLVKRSGILMIPGKLSCPNGWNIEYSGYLMAARHTHPRSEFVCMDGDAQVIPGGAADHNGALFYNAVGRCDPLLCPPYVEGRELTCVVCSTY